MKRPAGSLIALIVFGLLYGGSYVVWSRMALSVARKYDSEGFYFVPTNPAGTSVWEMPLRVIYHPCTLIDVWGFGGSGPSSAPLVDLSSIDRLSNSHLYQFLHEFVPFGQIKDHRCTACRPEFPTLMTCWAEV